MKAKTLIMIVLPAICLLGLTLALIPAQEPADPGGGAEAVAPPATPAELEQLLGADDAAAGIAAQDDPGQSPPATPAPSDLPTAPDPAANGSNGSDEGVPVPEDDESEFLRIKPEDDVQIPGMEEPTEEASERIASIRFDDVALEDVIKMFIRVSGANIIMTTTNLAGKTVTVNLTDVEWKPALNSILGTHGLMLDEQTPGTEVYTIVAKQPDLPPPMVVRTKMLEHATTGEIMPVLKTMLSPGANITSFPSRNALVFRSTEANIAEMTELLKELDIAVKQVCIETKFMELNDEATKKLGIKWDSLEEFGLRLGAGPFTSTEEITREKSKDSELSQWENRNNLDIANERFDIDNQQYEESSTSYSESPPNSGNWIATTVITPTRTVTDTIDAGKNVTMDVVDSFSQTIVEKQAAILEIESLDIIMSALKKTDGVSIISNPKIIVTSGYSNAVFRVGRREPIITTEVTRGTTDSPGDKVVAKLDTTVSTDAISGGFINTGIELRVIPTVKTDEFIEARIDPTLTRKLGDKQVGDNYWPIMSVKQIATQFTLRSGQTVAIGGLTDTSDDVKVSKIPLLGDIPIIGKYLFSHTSETKLQVETIVFVTLSLAMPETLHKNDGIPENAELVHKQMIRSNSRRQLFQADLDDMREDAEAEMVKKADKVKSRLLKKRK
jgi:type II secretory pathway component GspD/PulD (secretin)